MTLPDPLCVLWKPTRHAGAGRLLGPEATMSFHYFGTIATINAWFIHPSHEGVVCST